MQPPWTEPPSPSDPLPKKTSVAVVGASPAGLYLALELAKTGVNVTVLERREVCGRGCSGRDPGVLTGGLPEHPWRLIHSIGEAKTAELYEISKGTRRLIAGLIDLDETALQLAIDQREIGELSQSVHALSAIGVPASLLEATDCNDKVGGTGFTAGMSVEGETAVNMEAAIARLVTAARSAGAHVVTQANVTALSRISDDHLVQTSVGAVRADVVVLCAGTELGPLDPWFADKVLPVREHALRFADVSAPIPAGRAQYGYVSWRRDHLGGLRVSGCRWATQHLEMGETVEEPSDVVLSKVEAFARRHLPVADCAISHRWARILTATCDGLPILGPMPGDPTLVSCTGFQGFGPALGMACGAGVATGLLTGRSPLPDWLSPRRFL